MPMTTLEPPQRRRALAELDARIDRAERTQDRCRFEVQDQAAAARSTARPTAALRVADERLALLRQSREVLLGEEDRSSLAPGPTR